MASELFPDAIHDAVHIDGEQAGDAIRDVYNTLRKAGKITHSPDNIAYTEDFERLYLRVHRLFPLTRNEVSTTLINRRKRGECKFFADE